VFEVMKLIVEREFWDRYDGTICYKVGDAVSFDDKERVADLIARGLVRSVGEEVAETTEEPKAKRGRKKTCS